MLTFQEALQSIKTQEPKLYLASIRYYVEIGVIDKREGRYFSEIINHLIAGDVNSFQQAALQIRNSLQQERFRIILIDGNYRVGRVLRKLKNYVITAIPKKGTGGSVKNLMFCEATSKEEALKQYLTSIDREDLFGQINYGRVGVVPEYWLKAILI